MNRHSMIEKINGVNRSCSLSQPDVKDCSGYQMIGDRACDNRHLPGFKEGDKIVICKFNKINI